MNPDILVVHLDAIFLDATLERRISRHFVTSARLQFFQVAPEHEELFTQQGQGFGVFPETKRDRLAIQSNKVRVLKIVG